MQRRDDGVSNLPSTKNGALSRSLPTFLEHCKPKGTTSKSFNIWLNRMSNLKPSSKKKLARRNNNRKVRCPAPSQNGIVSVPNVDVIRLQRSVTDNTEILGKFMYFDWQKQGLYHTLDQKTNMSIDKFQEIDSGRKRHVIAYDNQTSKLCLFAKISRENVSRKLSGRRSVERLRFFGTEMSRCMQNVKRGKQRSSEDCGCFFIGERANRSAPGTGEYQCKPNISNNEMKSLRSLASDIVKGHGPILGVPDSSDARKKFVRILSHFFSLNTGYRAGLIRWVSLFTVECSRPEPDLSNSF